MVTERRGFWSGVRDSITLILAMIPPHGQLRRTGQARGSDAVRVGGMETGSRTHIQELCDALETQARFERQIVGACRRVWGP
jgi:hypothetical protein